VSRLPMETGSNEWATVYNPAYNFFRPFVLIVMHSPSESPQRPTKVWMNAGLKQGYPFLLTVALSFQALPS
jgi:hypothetical protein